MGWLTTSEVLPCTVEVEHSDESLHAHVALDGNPDIGPGDRVRVHGAAIRIAFGEKISVRRAATLTARLEHKTRGSIHLKRVDLVVAASVQHCVAVGG